MIPADVSGSCRTIVDVLRDRSETHPDRVAFTYLERGEEPATEISFLALDRSARNVAAFLQAKLAPGDAVMLVFPNEPDFITALLGCLFAGVIAVPVAPPRNARSMERLHNLACVAGATLVIASDRLRNGVQKFVKTAGPEQPEWLFAGEIPRGLEARWRDVRLDAGATAVLQFTSGSTGSPKGVLVSHRNILHNCSLLRSVCGSSAGLRMVSWLPFFHDWGLVGCLLFPMVAGGSCWFFDPPDFLQRPRRWLDAIGRFRATVSCAPNFAYELCVQTAADAEHGADLSSWRMAMVGAEPVRQVTLERFAAAFAPQRFRREAFYPSYGLAESTLIVTGGQRFTPPVYLRVDRSSLDEGRVIPVGYGHGAEERVFVGLGRALLDQGVRIVHPETRRPCEELEIGEIWISGPSVAAGYWRQAEETQKTFQAVVEGRPGEMCLRSGDLGFLLDGELFVCGRLKDVVIKAGANFFAEDLEHSAVQSHPCLRQGCGAAFGVDLDGSERLVVVQEIDYGKRPDLQQVVASIQRAISREHGVLADAIAVLRAGTLEKTTSGKVRRQHTRSRFLADDLHPLAFWKSW